MIQNMNINEMLNNNNNNDYCNVNTGLKRSKSFNKDDCGVNENESKSLLQKSKNAIVIPKLEIDKLKGYEQDININNNGKDTIKMNDVDVSDNNHTYINENKFISYDKYKFIFEDEITPRSERKNKRKKSTIGNSGNETERSKLSRRRRTVSTEKM
jgi:hypothetical protein